jgi:hypothetical protein
MALDLYFHPRKGDFEALRAADFSPTSTQQRARRKAIDALLARHGGCSLDGDPLSGRVRDFPLGELQLFPGYLHWSLHGEPDHDAVHAIVAGFVADGWVCVDPQQAGFADAPAGATALASFDQLIGAEFLGVSLLRDWGAGLQLDFALADGRPVRLEFVHFTQCPLPDPAVLLGRRVCAVDYRQDRFDTLSFDFGDGIAVSVVECVPNGGTIGPAPKRRR